MQHVIKVDEEEECVPVVLERMGAARFIRVDGHSGVGKSRIAKALVAELGWHRIETDKFLDGQPRGKRKYPEMVKIEEMLEGIRANRTPGVILDGICLDHLVLPNSFGTEFRIYMQSFYAPEHNMDEKRRRSKLGTDTYHKAFEPERRADLVVMKIALT